MKTIIWHLATLVICFSTCAAYGQSALPIKPADETAHHGKYGNHQEREQADGDDQFDHGQAAP